MAGRRRKTGAAAEAEAVESLFEPAPAQKEAAARELNEMPELDGRFTGIRESVFTLPDPEGEFKHLEQALSLTEALTPGNLQAALNTAEDNARRAHKLYVNAKAELDAFERECDAVVDGMREAANKELQSEKARGERSKAITDADIKGRASILFPDEWKQISSRRIRGDGMLSQLRQLSMLWELRCRSLATMLSAGKRS